LFTAATTGCALFTAATTRCALFAAATTDCALFAAARRFAGAAPRRARDIDVAVRALA
jgi:hypothetical protein